MAIVTLPNGAKYNTGLQLYEQPMTDAYSGSLDFAESIQTEGIVTDIFISGSNPNLPKRHKTIFTDTQYDTYNYILEYTYLYEGTTYKGNGNSIYIKVEDK